MTQELHASGNPQAKGNGVARSACGPSGNDRKLFPDFRWHFGCCFDSIDATFEHAAAELVQAWRKS